MGWPPCAFGMGFVPAIVVCFCGARVRNCLNDRFPVYVRVLCAM